jgi:hypothetical protein
MLDDINDLKLQLAEAKTNKKFADLVGEIHVAEAKTDAKFYELFGEMRTEFGKVGVRLDGLERSTAGTKTTIVVTGIAVFVAIIAVLTFAQAGYGLGVSMPSIIKSTVAEYIQEHPASK